jgi:hypothetical protein
VLAVFLQAVQQSVGRCRVAGHQGASRVDGKRLAAERRSQGVVQVAPDAAAFFLTRGDQMFAGALEVEGEAAGSRGFLRRVEGRAALVG